jgi:general secretion pathway protein D
MKTFFFRYRILRRPFGFTVESSREGTASVRGARLVRHAWLVVGLFIIGASLAACNSIISQQNPPGTPDVFDNIRNVDLLPRFPRDADSNSNSRPSRDARPETYMGTVAPAADGAAPASNGEGYELNFENAPVTTVAKVILGDILEARYMIDARVQGNVTLASGRPVPKSELLFVLESALRMSNVALLREGRSYRLIPISEASGTGSIDSTGGRPEVGYGLTVIPLRYVSAQTLIKLLDSFAVKPGTIRADAARNMLVIQGPGAERRSAVETVMSFDVDWMRGQSVGIYPVRNSTPELLISELEKILDSGEGGLSQNLVKLQPISRLNAILVVASKPDMLRSAATWINRLDKGDASKTGVKVYHVQYGDARQIAALLNTILVGQSNGVLDSGTNQIAPNSGLSVQSSIDRSIPNQPGLRIAGGQAPASSVPASSAPGASGAPGTDLAARLQAAFPGSANPAGGVGGPAVLPGVRIVADAVNNSLLIYANQESYRVIERTLREIDRPQLQVAIDATIAEITLNENLAYGVQVFLKSSDLGLGRNKGSIVLTPSTAANAAGGALIGRVLPGFNFLVGSEQEPRLILEALRGVSDVKVLSTPSVVVVDNQPATLQVGDQVPVTTGTATVLTGNTPVVNSIDYRNTGVILHVIPRINSNGNVTLDVEQEISAVGANADTLTPTVSQRKVKSRIAVASGQTVLLAGLISERQDNSRSGVPLVDQLGELGRLFGSTKKISQRTELIIFIRPQIIRDSVDANRVAEELRSKLRGRRLVPEEPPQLQLSPKPKPPAPSRADPLSVRN